MKADDTTIKIFLEGSKQFIVPLFQRTYSWKDKHIRRLWEDIGDIKSDKDNENTHFFGSFVTMPIPSSPSGVSKYVIIDGQQRLVTIFVFLAALRNRIIEIQPDYEKKDEINEMYLINKYHPEDKHKVLPTKADEKIFFKILDESKLKTNKKHLIVDTYNFFGNELSTIDSLDELINLKDTMVSKFSVVDIRLEKGDDPYLIFESLNATGEPLTQADLIRNYLFMKISQGKQQEVYEKIWFPMQQKLEGLNLERFIRHYLAMDGNIPNTKKIYATFKDITDESAKSEVDIINKMKDLLKFSEYYYRFLHPKNEMDKKLRNYLEKFNTLEMTTSYPLLLRLYDDYVNKKLSRDDLSESLKAIETYIVRRAVCGIPTQALNRYFPTIYKSLEKTNIVISLKNKLQTTSGVRRMPSDDEFEQCLKGRNLYGNKILRYALEEIEKYNNKEVVNFEELQIEHIMPQTLSDGWKEMLGNNWELIHQKYLNTLGNLTLTGYNPEYSNKFFIEKRDMKRGFKDSGLRLNRDISKLNEWTEEEIKNRAKILSKIALEIWPSTKSIVVGGKIETEKVKNTFKKEKNASESDLKSWMRDKIELLCRIYNEGRIVSKERLHEIWKEMGKDVRGLGGFFVGKKASLVWTSDKKVLLTNKAGESIERWTGKTISEYAKKFKK